jgi:hypothetical protein
MRKILTAVVVVASVGAAAIATPSPAKAWWGWGPAVVGGVVAGAIVGGAIASRLYYPYYGRRRSRGLFPDSWTQNNYGTS